MRTLLARLRSWFRELEPADAFVSRSSLRYWLTREHLSRLDGREVARP